MRGLGEKSIRSDTNDDQSSSSRAGPPERLARTHPLLFINKHNCQADLPFLLLVSSITTAFNNPRPLTSLINGLPISLTLVLKISPSL